MRVSLLVGAGLIATDAATAIIVIAVKAAIATSFAIATTNSDPTQRSILSQQTTKMLTVGRNPTQHQPVKSILPHIQLSDCGLVQMLLSNSVFVQAQVGYGH